MERCRHLLAHTLQRTSPRASPCQYLLLHREGWQGAQLLHPLPCGSGQQVAIPRLHIATWAGGQQSGAGCRPRAGTAKSNKQAVRPDISFPGCCNDDSPCTSCDMHIVCCCSGSCQQPAPGACCSCTCLVGPTFQHCASQRAAAGAPRHPNFSHAWQQSSRQGMLLTVSGMV
jgi:hypothetical protein